MRRIKRLCQVILFVIRNICSLIGLKNIPFFSLDDKLFVTGASAKELKEALAIYSYYNNFKQIDIAKRIVYFFLSRKCVFIVKDETANSIIGLELYYVNKRDVMEHTVHQGFRGVLKEWQGKKIGTAITLHAIRHFNSGRFNGISSRVSLNNLPSLRSNMNLGFKPIEKYFDRDMNEERYYLICPFDDNSQAEIL